jgi:hypothetical protein
LREGFSKRRENLDARLDLCRLHVDLPNLERELGWRLPTEKSFRASPLLLSGYSDAFFPGDNTT